MPMENTKKFGYEKHNADIIANTEKKRICVYFTVLDTHKIKPVDIRFSRQARRLDSGIADMGRQPQDRHKQGRTKHHS